MSFGEDIWDGEMLHVEEASYPYNAFGKKAKPPAFDANIFQSVTNMIASGMNMAGGIANAANNAGRPPTVATAPPVATAAPAPVAAVTPAKEEKDVAKTPAMNTNLIIGIAAAALGIPLLIMAVRK